MSDPNRGWEAEVWRRNVHRVLKRAEAPPASWVRRIAAVRFTASKPRLLQPFAKRLGQMPYAIRPKPFNFLQAAPVTPGGHAAHLDPLRCRLVTAYQSEASQWQEVEWWDLYSGHFCRVRTSGTPGPKSTILKTVGDVVEQFWEHPEHKSLAPDGTRCSPTTRGLLRRRPVRPSRIDVIGKEAHRWEEVELSLLADPDEAQVIYSPSGQAAWRDRVVTALKRLSPREVAHRAGVSERTIFRLRAGRDVGKRARVALNRLARAVTDGG